MWYQSRLLLISRIVQGFRVYFMKIRCFVLSMITSLPCTIGNLKLYVMADLGTSVNLMPKSLFKYSKLADLKETNMVVEMVDMPKKALLGIVENILVKIDKFLFHFDFVVIDMLEGPNKTMLWVNHFEQQYMLRICHSRVPFEKIYITSSVRESEYFNPLEIETDVFSYDSPACLLFEQSTHPCSNVSIDIVDSSDHMQELKGSQEDEVGSHLLENVVSRWHVCKPICVTIKDCEKDYGKWPTCNPDLSFCSGYDAIYGKKESGMLKQWIFFEIMKDKMLGDDSFEEWVKSKLGHTTISEAIKCDMFKEWIKENFNFEVDFEKTHDDPYSRMFNVYKEEFDKEMEQLVNEYELKAGRKRYALEEVWDKCEKFHDTTKLWYDKGFEEEELWQNGIKGYTPPLVKSETFEVHRYTFKNRRSFISITKQEGDVLSLGRGNMPRFMVKIRKEMDEEGETTRKT
ncbi:phospholipase-like protein [Tanacetum coccineum]